MAHADGRTTNIVSITDIRMTLGLGSTHLGYLCGNAHGRTNKWSKNKPVRHTTLEGITDTQRASVNYGLDVKAHQGLGNINTAGSFLHTMKNTGVQWEYLPPRGKAADGHGDEPCRQGDFRGYWHYAEQPFGDTVSSPVIIENGTATIQVNGIAVEEGNLLLTDLKIPDGARGGGTAFGELYPGVVLFYGSSNYMIGTSSQRLGQGGTFSVDFPTNSAGTYTTGLFLCTAAIDPQGSVPANCTFVPLPLPPQQVSIYTAAGASGVAVIPEGEWNAAHTMLKWRYNIVNTSGTSKSVSGFGVWLYRQRKTGNQSSELVATLLSDSSSPSITVAANDTYTPDYRETAVSDIDLETYDYTLTARWNSLTWEAFIEDNTELPG